MKRILQIAALAMTLGFIGSGTTVADDLKLKTGPAQRIDAPFRLFATDNVWTQLLLDTRDGRVWQVCFTVNADGFSGKAPISVKPLVDDIGAKPGRFTLYPTANMWTFLLLDQEDGRVWQCQFAPEAKNRFILPLEQP